MKETLTAIISIVATAVIIPLISLIGERLIAYLNAKTDSQKEEHNLAKAQEIVMNVVKAVYQTFVDDLKKNGTFDNAAKAEAFAKAKHLIFTQLTGDIMSHLISAYGDIEIWVETQIESSLNTLKCSKL